ncbi:zinc ribbon domain-containing protein [Shimia sp.]|uniref:Zn-ribbon domain-containing OB-fold protein n=1 Tax=Shimia sp. TaxID=1954381 RepID=UPI00329A0E37
MKHRLTLDYSVPVGDLAPYFDALAEGKALASECSGCGFVAFPARNLCGACGCRDMKWRQLEGSARLLFRSDGNSSFALVKFDGADTKSTVGLIHPERTTQTGELAAPLGDAPGLWLALADDNEGNDDGK